MASADHAKSVYATTSEALQAAKQRFAERNAKSSHLHEESNKALPGGNTRSVLHTAPFPVFLKSGKGYQVTSEDGQTYTDLVGEFTAALYGHSQPSYNQRWSILSTTLVSTWVERLPWR